MVARKARTDCYVDLREYAAIGDGKTVVLIARDGSVDWLPIPDLDSTPVFARLLDADGGGQIEPAPTEPYDVKRSYLSGTKLLRTTFTTESGIARVTGALVTGALVTGVAARPPRVEDGPLGKILRIDTVNLTVRGIQHGPRGRGDRAISAWRARSKEFSYDGPWALHVQRSARALKLLLFASTDSVAAAPTTSLPESLHGGKNWEYRYAWVRDLAYTVHSLVRFGLREKTHSAVASGNRANDQVQLSVFGDLFDVIRSYVTAGNVLDVETGRLLESFAERAALAWRQEGAGMWALQEQRRNTSSKRGCWQALDAAAQLCEAGHIPGDAKRWRAECAEIRTWIDGHCRSDALQAYVACSFWMASALACVGRHDEATALVDAAITIEEFSGADGASRSARRQK